MMPSDTVYDVIIVGGGVVGCAIAYTLSEQGYKCLLLEKEKYLVAGASSGNRFVKRARCRTFGHSLSVVLVGL